MPCILFSNPVVPPQEKKCPEKNKVIYKIISYSQRNNSKPSGLATLSLSLHTGRGGHYYG